MKTILTALAAAGLVLSSGPVLAQATSSLAQGQAFIAVDTDDSGGVSWAEFSLVFTDITEEQFNTADVNADGLLDEAEYGTLVLQTGSITPPADDAILPAGPGASLTDTPE